MGCESVDWLHLAQDRDQLPDLTNTVMNFGLEEICCQAVRRFSSLEGLKGKVAGVWGSGRIDPHFLDLGPSWR
jgi:hypothetical protein